MYSSYVETLLLTSVANPDPGSSTFLTSGSGWEKSRSGINIADNISECSVFIFWVKNIQILSVVTVADPGWKNLDPGSRRNFLDPQHCF